jgi:hypothetical protein
MPKAVHLNQDGETGRFTDGSITCAGEATEELQSGKVRVIARCSLVIHFLPDDGHLPEHFLDTTHPQYSVNHAGCYYALDGTETINVIDPKEVVAFFKQKPDPQDPKDVRQAQAARNAAYDAAVALRGDRVKGPAPAPQA